MEVQEVSVCLLRQRLLLQREVADTAETWSLGSLLSPPLPWGRTVGLEPSHCHSSCVSST